MLNEAPFVLTLESVGKLAHHLTSGIGIEIVYCAQRLSYVWGVRFKLFHNNLSRVALLAASRHELHNRFSVFC